MTLQKGKGVRFRTFITFVLSLIASCVGHPQCLDFRAPFYAEKTLTFCPEYQTFGCCTKRSEDDLRLESEKIKSQVSGDVWTKCGGYVRELLCQKCSPYAAHIYDGEATLRPRSFPGLCTSYCRQFYRQCKEIIPYLAYEDTELIQKSIQGENAFCQHVQLLDRDYCYPDLKTNDILNNRITLVQVTSEGCLCVEKFADGLYNPVFARHAGDGSGRLFVGEVNGRIFVYYLNGTREPSPFLDIQEATLNSNFNGDERGLLGLAFHPNFKTNGRLFIFYSTHSAEQSKFPPLDHKIRISEFKVLSNNRNKADKWSERVILEINEPFWNHNGGEILFGDDGYLYVFVGDGGAGGDPQGNAQNTSTLLGKVLRININVDSRYAYGIPNDNPFIRDPAFRPEIYAYGVRNIWRCGKDAGDPQTGEGKGRILCGDVGQSAFEEIDLLKKGVNYGWNSREGFECFSDQCGLIGQEELPVHAYPHYVGKSVTGGHFYRGCRSPNLNGYYIYGDYMTGKLFRLVHNNITDTWDNKEINMCGPDFCTPPLSNSYTVPHIMSFGEDEFGEIYMLSTSNASSAAPLGAIYKIVDPARRGNPETCASAGDSTTEQVTPTRPPTRWSSTQRLDSTGTSRTTGNSQSSTGRVTSTNRVSAGGTTSFSGINGGNPGRSRQPDRRQKSKTREKKNKNNRRGNARNRQRDENRNQNRNENKKQNTTDVRRGGSFEKYFLRLEGIRMRMCRRRQNPLCRFSRIFSRRNRS